MTDAELERMRNYAEAAREHPTWSVAYAQDVPRLLAELDIAREALRRFMVESAKQITARDYRLRTAEMFLDRIGAEIDGVPWREAARLMEAIDGEPVTEPVAPNADTGVNSPE